MNQSEISLAMRATIQRLRILPVIAIDRVDDVSPLADALDQGGLPIAEIILRTEAGLEAIAKLSGKKRGRG